jgi:hypothetical protein
MLSNSSKSKRTGPSTLAMRRLIVSVPGGGVLRRWPEHFQARVAGELAGDVDPGCLSTRLRVPGVADEHRHLCLWRLGQSRLIQEVDHAGKRRCGRARVGQVPERGQHVRLAAAHLRHQHLHRRCVLCLTRKAT